MTSSSVPREVLLDFMRVVEAAGTSLAFPTRTVHLVREREAGSGTPGRSASVPTSAA